MLQDKIQTEPIRVRTLLQDKERYRNYPPFQREYVWSLIDKQAWINTLLRNLFCLEFLLMEETSPQGHRFHVIDGQQRLEATLEFLANGFPTMSIKEARKQLYTREPVAPECTYAQLAPALQQTLLEYKFRFTMIPQGYEDELEEMYLGINRHKPLTVGERLFIHNGKARHMALALLEHPFWQSVYQGKVLRKETFQAASMILALETLSFPLNLRIYTDEKAPMNRLVLGDLDNELTDTLKNTVWKRLTEAERLFKGVRITGKTDVIPAYEACMFLDEQGFRLMDSKPGCLHSWYMQAKRGTVNDRLQKRVRFRLMDYVSVQKEFWDIHRSPIQDVKGLAR